jgi:aminocarboxymuconate-semialdehyde decarboxylase
VTRTLWEGSGNLHNVIGNPLETTIALAHLIFEGTFDRFPGLKICGAHGGGFLASYIGRSDASCTWTPGPENCKPLERHPSDYFKSNILCDSLVFNHHQLRYLVAQHGVSQVVFGSDFPAGWPTKHVDDVLEADGLSDAEKEAILGGNLMKLLRIEA